MMVAGWTLFWRYDDFVPARRENSSSFHSLGVFTRSALTIPLPPFLVHRSGAHDLCFLVVLSHRFPNYPFFSSSFPIYLQKL